MSPVEETTFTIIKSNFLCRTRLVAAEEATETEVAVATTFANTTGMQLDLPVDPNEPTYCFCNQVSYGDMIACDNPDVCNQIIIYLLFSSLIPKNT